MTRGRESRHQERMRARLSLIVATGLLAVTLVAGFLAVRALMRPAPRPEWVEIGLGGARLVVPRGHLRFAGDSGRLDRLDLAARFPDFGPAGAASPAPAPSPDGERDETLVFLTLTPNDGSLDPAERPTRLYARFLDPAVWTHPGGLLMRRFQPGAPYEKEELYIAPPEGRAFFARCPVPGSATDGLPDFCMTEFRVDGVDAQMRFSGALLSDWERLADGARALIRRMAR